MSRRSRNRIDASPALQGPLERAVGQQVGAQKSPAAVGKDRFSSRELTKLTEDNYDNLTYFDGDRLCQECADNAGVAY